MGKAVLGKLSCMGTGLVFDGRVRAYRSCINLDEVVWIISIFHGCMVWIEKSVTRVTDQHHEACRVMPNSDPE